MKTVIETARCSSLALLSVVIIAVCLSSTSGCGTSGETKNLGANQAVGKRPEGEGRPKLWLTAKEDPDELVVTVNYEQSAIQRPRVADIRLVHSESLELVDAAVGGSASIAHKELTTQTPQPGLIRLILLSRDTVELGSGELVRLRMKRVAKGPVKVDFLIDKPVFAPAESLEGLLIGDPVAL